MSQENFEQDAIAIIGAGLRLPGGRNTVSEYWTSLLKGENFLEPIPKDRFDIDSFYFPDRRPGSIISKMGGFVTDYKKFDPLFFGISPKEAAAMDPQQRLLLECTWEAFEDAGLKIDEFHNSQIGVYMGVSASEYGLIQQSFLGRENINSKTNAGVAMSITANRISYLFGFKGPSYAIDTACSSFFSALHVAYVDLKRGRIPMALVGGSNSQINPESYIGFTRGEFLSPDSACKTFDISANGYVRSEGAGTFLLKPYKKALADGDPIYALIHGSFVNQDGRSDGMSAPSLESQKQMLESAYSEASIDKSKVLYVEAHGTGTQAGDLAEATALGEVLGVARSPENPLFVGSCKSNLGHMETASGIASLAKAMMVARTKLIPPNLHFNTANPKLKLSERNLKVPQEVTPLKTQSDDFFIGMSSFGFGGSNAHLALGPAPVQKSDEKTMYSDPCFRKEPFVFISGKSEQGLKKQAEKYLSAIAENPSVTLEKWGAATLAKRSVLNLNLAVWAPSTLELQKNLKDYLLRGSNSQSSLTSRTPAKKSKICFVYSGMGTQWWGMGRKLINEDSKFSTKIREVSDLLTKHGWTSVKKRSLLEELQQDESSSEIHATATSQVAIFAIQVALTKKLKKWGIAPDFVLGHSVGEVAASYASGALSLDQACFLIANRSQVQALSEGLGSMLAVELSEESAKTLCQKYNNKINLAALNSKDSLVLSGDQEILKVISQELSEKNIFNRTLEVRVPFHSYRMEENKDVFLKRISQLKISTEAGNSSVIQISTVSGKIQNPAELTPDYWYRNMREPVRFEQALQTANQDHNCLFIEIGAHPALSQHIEKTFPNAISLSTLNKKKDDFRCLSELIFRAHSSLIPFKMEAVVGQVQQWSFLPFQAFDKQEYWIESDEFYTQRIGKKPHPFISEWSAGQPGYDADTNFKVVLDPRKWYFLKDHKVQEEFVIPGALSLELSIAAANLLSQTQERTADKKNVSMEAKPVHLRSVDFEKMIFIDDVEKAVQLNLNLSPFTGRYALVSNQEKTIFVHGEIAKQGLGKKLNLGSLDVIKSRLKMHQELVAAYELLGKSGLDYGPTFRSMTEAYSSSEECLVKIELHQDLHSEYEKFYVHPVVLDNAFQSVLLTLDATSQDRLPIYIPSFVQDFYFHCRPKSGNVWAYLKINRHDQENIVADVCLLDELGNEFITICGLVLQYIKGSADQPLDDMLYTEKYIEKTSFYLQTIDPVFHNKTKLDLKAFEDSLRESKFLRDLEFHDLQPDHDLDHLALLSMTTAFIKLGLPNVKGSIWKLEDVLGLCSQQTSIQKTAELFLFSLCENSFLKLESLADEKNKVYSVQRVVTFDELENHIKIVEGHAKRIPGRIRFPKRVLSRQYEVLSGEVDPVKLVFGDAAPNELFECYSQNVSSLEYTQFIAEYVSEILTQNKSSSKKIRILEVGGGTGGCTSHVLEKLQNSNYEYVFTDISPAFFDEASQRFANYSNFECQSLDLEKDIELQGFYPHSFDIVLAFNVIHATKSIQKSLKTLSHLLKQNGICILLEISGKLPAIEGTFGLLEGYTHFEDFKVRQNKPTIPGNEWQKQLLDAGFVDAASSSLTVNRQNVVIASNQIHLDLVETTTFEILKRKVKEKPIKRLWIVGSAPQEFKLNAHKFAEVQNDFTEENFQSLADFDWSSLPKTFLPDQLQIVIFVTPLFGNSVMNWATGGSPTECQLDFFEANTKLLKVLDQNAVKATLSWIFTDLKVTTEVPVRSLISQTTAAFKRVANNEVTTVHFRQIDAVSEVSGFEILCELWEDRFEDEVYLTGEKRLVPRIVNQVIQEKFKKIEVGRGAYFLGMDERGSGLDSIVFREPPTNIIGPNEVKLQIKRVGLNFRDLLIATGMLTAKMLKGDGLVPQLGFECSAEVVAVGSEVTDIKPGDRVVSFTTNCIAFQTTVNRKNVILLPDSINWDFGASLVVYVTAHYTLLELARIKQGDKVLIHSAAGGVGLAAIEICQAIGATVYATASRLDRQDYLKKRGIEYVYDSKNLEFREEILRDTQGYGVDVVLNSLAGPAIWESLKLVAPFGRFIEIGKMDLLQNTRLGLEPFLKNISYFGFDLALISGRYPDLLQKVVTDTITFIQKYKIPMIPFQKFEVADCKNAFKAFSKGEHIGKFILDTEKSAPLWVGHAKSFQAQENSQFIIVGGTSGFGLACAEWLAVRGVKTLILVSRSGIKYEDDQVRIKNIIDLDVKIVIRNVDISIYDEVKSLLIEFPNVTGIIHGAMVLHDNSLIKMDRSQFEKVMKPKVDGSWNLHSACEELRIKPSYFICFSSMAAELGNAGQANYAVANGFMQGLIAQRRFDGLPGTLISWGVLGGAGYVARRAEENFSIRHWFPIPLSQSLQALEKALLMDIPNLMVQIIDWSEYSKAWPKSSQSNRLAQMRDSKAEKSQDSSKWISSLRTMSEIEALESLKTGFKLALSKIVGLPAAQIESDQSLLNFGLDSLSANQLRGWILKDLDMDIPLLKIMRGPTLQALSEELLSQIRKKGAAIQKANASNWLDAQKTEKEPTARIIYFPYLLAGSESHFSWSQKLDSRIEIVTVKLPGISGSPTEEFRSDYAQMASELAKELNPYLDRPTLFLGVSFGALMAIESLKFLNEEQKKCIRHLMLIGMISLEENRVDAFHIFAENYKKTRKLSEEHVAILKQVGTLDSVTAIGSDEDFAQKMFDQMESVLKHSESYANLSLDIPITALRGDLDPLNTDQSLSAKKAMSGTKAFKQMTVPGKHLFVNEETAALVKLIKETFHDVIV